MTITSQEERTMTEPTTTAELTPAIKAGKLALHDPKADLTTVARAISGAASRALAKPAEVKPPKPVQVSEEQTKAVAAVVDLALNLTLPTEVRKLEDGERANLIAARLEFDAAAKVIEDGKDAIKQAFHNHFDKVAEDKGDADATTPVNKDGHYILEDKESGGAPGADKKITREVSAGGVTFGSAQTEADALKQLVDDGLLDKDVYLKVTRQTRVVDEHALFEAMKGDEALIPIIEQALTVSPDTASINVRKA
jgi:hypothetical protein